MAIPDWVTKVAEEIDKTGSVNFSDETYNKLMELYKAGKLDEQSSALVEEIECLRDVINNAVSKASESLLGVKKEAAPKVLPFDIGDERLKEVPTPKATPEPKKMLPARLKEPETTKWKEIRFNKRTGTWQVVITIRHTRNFSSENEAIEFTKKAELDTNIIDKTSKK